MFRKFSTRTQVTRRKAIPHPNRTAFSTRSESNETTLPPKDEKRYYAITRGDTAFVISSYELGEPVTEKEAQAVVSSHYDFLDRIKRDKLIAEQARENEKFYAERYRMSKEPGY